MDRGVGGRLDAEVAQAAPAGGPGRRSGSLKYWPPRMRRNSQPRRSSGDLPGYVVPVGVQRVPSLSVALDGQAGAVAVHDEVDPKLPTRNSARSR